MRNAAPVLERFLLENSGNFEIDDRQHLAAARASTKPHHTRIDRM